MLFVRSKSGSEVEYRTEVSEFRDNFVAEKTINDCILAQVQQKCDMFIDKVSKTCL